MSGEVRTRWQALIAQLEKDRFFNKRYANCAKEPKALYDLIGEDLDSSNESIRNAAYWVVVRLTPELINLLHERETRNPGWKDIEGKDQKMVDEGIAGSKCILKHLHTKLVKEHRFKVRDGNKKDPRPYLKKAIKRWEIDEYRSRRDQEGTIIEVPLDYEAALEIPDPAVFPEIETETYNDLWREYKILFRDRDAFDVFIAHHVDDSPLEKIRESWGIPSDEAVRQQKSRLNKEIIARRDALFSFLLFEHRQFSKTGKIPRFVRNPLQTETWINRVKRAVHPGAWLYDRVPDGNTKVAIRPLTSGLKRTSPHIYLVAIKKDHQNYITQSLWNLTCDWNTTDYPGNIYAEHVGKLLNPTSRKLQGPDFMFCWLKIESTELPGLNDALADLPYGLFRGDYYVWLVSNSSPLMYKNARRMLWGM